MQTGPSGRALLKPLVILQLRALLLFLRVPLLSWRAHVDRVIRVCCVRADLHTTHLDLIGECLGLR